MVVNAVTLSLHFLRGGYKYCIKPDFANSRMYGVIFRVTAKRMRNFQLTEAGKEINVHQYKSRQEAGERGLAEAQEQRCAPSDRKDSACACSPGGSALTRRRRGRPGAAADVRSRAAPSHFPCSLFLSPLSKAASVSLLVPYHQCSSLWFRQYMPFSQIRFSCRKFPAFGELHPGVVLLKVLPVPVSLADGKNRF